MFLLPVSHEDASVRRMPWVSVAILGLCVLVQLHSCATEPELEARAGQLMRDLRSAERALVDARIAAHAAAHPEEEPAEPRDPDRAIDAPDHMPMLGFQGPHEVPEAPAEIEVRAQIARELEDGTLETSEEPEARDFLELRRELEALRGETPAMRLGYRPALDGLARIFSSMFAHADWLHLIGNMWFLYLVGCNLEDRWGRWQFASFYAVAGIVAALTFTLLHPDSQIPLIGASGAVAGAMGAFMVCFARTKVKIFYIYWLFLMPRHGTFNASAWLVLALWVGEQGLMTLLEASGNGSGVAFSAHLGGFAFGAAVAAMLRSLGVDAELDAASGRAAQDAAEVFSEHPLYLEAMELRDRGDDAGARQRLVALIAEQPDHLAGREALFTLGIQSRDLTLLDYSAPWLIADYGRRSADEPLVDLFRQLRRGLPSYGLTDQELLRVATAARRLGDPERSMDAVRELLQQHPGSASMPKALWEAAEVQARYGSPDLRRHTLERIVRRFPEHACGSMAQRALSELGGEG